MRRMALRGLLPILVAAVVAAIPAEAARKMRPPLPKPKPAFVVTPGELALLPQTPGRPAPVIPREKPKRAGQAEPGPEAEAAEDLFENPFVAGGKPKRIDQADPEAEAETGENPFVDIAGLQTPVIPREKPKRAEEAAPEAEAETGDNPFIEKAGLQTPVIPRAKPKRPPSGEPQVEKKPAEPSEDAKPEPGEDFEICRIELSKLGMKFSVPEMPATDGKCHVPNPVQLASIRTPAGAVDFPSRPILNCIFAKRFATWVGDVAAPVIRTHTGQALSGIVTGPGFECRNRNGDGTAKVSEHAFGNAIDIVTFKLGKTSMAVSNVAYTQSDESRWLTALRVSACGYFTTVLGPGSNEAHAEHYHFDLGVHGKSGRYKICE